MPRQTQQSGLMKKLGAEGRKALVGHQGDDVTFDEGASLPPGIENGIARITNCYFKQFGPDTKFAGEYFFRASGVVVSPERHDGVPILGLPTSQRVEPICATPERKRKTIDDHVEWVLNQLRMLGLDTTSLDSKADDALENAAEAVASSGVYFRFRTWRGQPTEQYPDPSTNETWGGACDYDPENTDDVVENTGEAETVEPQVKEVDLEALAAVAEEDEAAGEKLKEIAIAAGMSEEEFDNLPSWEETPAAIRELQEGESPPSGEKTSPETPPEKGDCCKYKPPRKRKLADCEVVTVNQGDETVTLKNMETDDTYKSVSWDKLVWDD